MPLRGRKRTRKRRRSGEPGKEPPTFCRVKQPPEEPHMALAIPEVRAGTKGDPGALVQRYGVKTSSDWDQHTCFGCCRSLLALFTIHPSQG